MRDIDFGFSPVASTDKVVLLELNNYRAMRELLQRFDDYTVDKEVLRLARQLDDDFADLLHKGADVSTVSESNLFINPPHTANRAARRRAARQGRKS